MSHLTPEEVVDAVDNALTGDRHEHWRTCEPCRARADQLRGVLHDAQAADVPDPSPLFWPHFAQRVSDAIDREPASRSAWTSVWRRWTVMAPAAALASIAIVLVVTAPHQWPGASGGRAVDVAPGSAALAPNSAQAPPGDEALEDGSWRLVVDLVDDMNLDAAAPDALVTPGLADRALGDLQPEERDELLRLLRAELGSPES